ncbi:MAG: HAD family hydrolase [Kiloniellaceae bacterium]
MVEVVIFDLGGVLIDWNPRYLYRKLFDDEAEMERFLATVCTKSWNERQDAGRPVAEAVAELVARHPAQAALIEAYYARFPEMIDGSLEDSVAVLAELRARDVPLYCLTNFSAETFPHARARFEFLDWFRGILVSGEVGMRKPDPRIYRLFLRRYGVDAVKAVFIDDVAANVAGADAVGITGLHFSSASTLRRDLAALGLL